MPRLKDAAYSHHFSPIKNHPGSTSYLQNESSLNDIGRGARFPNWFRRTTDHSIRNISIEMKSFVVFLKNIELVWVQDWSDPRSSMRSAVPTSYSGSALSRLLTNEEEDLLARRYFTGAGANGRHQSLSARRSSDGGLTMTDLLALDATGKTRRPFLRKIIAHNRSRIVFWSHVFIP